jgi:hypothetical protein
VEVVKGLLRLLSYVFHVLLCVWLLALALLALIARAPSLQLSMLPWRGPTLLYILLFGSLAGLLILVSALSGSARWLFFLWSLVVAFLVIKSYFLSGYHFSPGEATTAMYLSVGSLIALLGSWFVVTRRRTAR